MTKKIQAYFKNEDQALNVKMKLMQYEVSHIEIGETKGAFNGKVIPAIPLIGGANNSLGSGGVGIPGGFLATGYGINPDSEPSDEHHTVLSGEISDEHYEEAVELIQHNQGYIE
ncbi:MAG: hypothetical protein JWM44_1275 [Bacilli bacterium]|nr:hypothetical protein [Bacilli bacterium]